MCFIYQSTDHIVELCPEWRKPQPTAQYFGSANKGLGLLYIDVEESEGRFKHWVGLDNFGVITIEEGEIDEEGVLENLRELFDKDWDWQLRKSDDYKYIVRFSPDRKVEKLVIGKASVFDLNRPGVVGSLSVWNGEIEPIGSLMEVWVQILGIPPKWVDWKTLHDVSSSIGRMVDVDWQLLFNSFFSSIRVKIQCKDPTKIPKERLFVFKDKVHLILFNPEGYEAINTSEGGFGKGGGEEKKEDDGLGDEDLSDASKEDD